MAGNLRFASELRVAMAAKGLTQTALARAVGYGATNLHKVLAGERIPAPEVVAALAEVLGRPALVDLAVAAKTARCALCGAPFVRHHRKPATRYCGRPCQHAASARQQRDWHRQKTLTETRMVRQRLDQYQLAVLAFCRLCEPDGVCRDAGCELRPVSPLRLAPRRARVA